ncbi:hypothetical protein RCL1_005294 [Eukaryota sp. TZLM3-RCL]
MRYVIHPPILTASSPKRGPPPQSAPPSKPSPATRSFSSPIFNRNRPSTAPLYISPHRPLRRFDNVLTTQLHHCIRAYLVESFEEYLKKYESSLSGTYFRTPDSLNHIARYRLVAIILRDVEKINPEKDLDSLTLTEFRHILIDIVNQSHDVYTVTATNLESNIMQSEKQSIIKFIKNVSESELLTVATLPFRRTLQHVEVLHLQSILLKEFSIPRFTVNNTAPVDSLQWFPISRHRPPFTEAFNMIDFAEFIGLEKLREILRVINANRILVVRDFGSSHCELDLSIFDPNYSPNDGGESYATDRNFNFVIYVSAENTITISGKDLLDQVQANWIDWEDYAYR